MVSPDFSVTYSFRLYHGPGVDSGPSENEHQENFVGGKGGRCVGLTTSEPSCAKCHEIWESKPPGTLWATPGLLRDCFTFTFTFLISVCGLLRMRNVSDSGVPRNFVRGCSTNSVEDRGQREQGSGGSCNFYKKFHFI